jgi:SAM-dependent methyltransferase
MHSDNDLSYIGDDLETMADTPRYVDWIIDHFRPHLLGRAAEFGAGIGTISARIVNDVSSLDLIEPTASLSENLLERFKGEEKVNVISAMLESYLSGELQYQYDSILLVNVLEHIENDKSALKMLFGALNTGGHLLIYVPALPFLFSNFDELVGHYRRYTRVGLAQILSEAGFQISYISYIDFLGILPWYLVNTVGGKTSLSPSTVKLYDRIGVPLGRFAERLIKPPIGKNVIVVAKKPE